MMYFGQPYFGQYGIVLVSGSGNVTVSITGVTASGAIGTIIITHANALTGNSIAGLSGFLKTTHSVPIAGKFATGSIGLLGSMIGITPTGVQASAAVGQISIVRFLTLFGNVATLHIGRIRGYNANYYFRDVFRPQKGTDSFLQLIEESRSIAASSIEDSADNSDNSSS